MEYPILNVPIIGGSLLIAVVAIVHVVIAHFAVGAGVFNAVHETLAIRGNDSVMLRFLRTHSRLIVLFPFVAGVVTGVGIWFTIALVAPRATSNLIHLFVWAWATEWSLFIVEIAAGYVYYFTWDRIDPRVHNVIGWIYAAAAVGSLVLINGIISFMLTPGQFTGPDSFWQNLFNPSFAPSALVRTISALALAAIFVIIVVNYCRDFTDDEKQHVVRAAGRWLIPLILMVPLAWWYFRSVPAEARNFIFAQSAMVMVLLFSFGVVASILIGGYAYLGILRGGRAVSGETGLLLLGIAIIATGSMEFVREGIRKPYLIRPSQAPAGSPETAGLYSTEMTPAELARSERESVLDMSPWLPRTGDPVQDGRSVFMIKCMRCHTADGAYNPVQPLVHGWSAAQYESNLANLHATKDAMPHDRPAPPDQVALEAFLESLNPALEAPAKSETPIWRDMPEPTPPGHTTPTTPRRPTRPRRP